MKPNLESILTRQQDNRERALVFRRKEIVNIARSLFNKGYINIYEFEEICTKNKQLIF